MKLLVQVALATGGCTNDACCRGLDACPVWTLEGGELLVFLGVLGSAGQVGFGSKSVQNNALTFALWSRRFFPLESTSTSVRADEGCLRGCFIVEKKRMLSYPLCSSDRRREFS